MITFTDIFCGAGGSSTGLVLAGMQLKLAANHWARAIETHAANHRDADHLCADINNYDMRRLSRTDVLWASPICTESSPAGGRKRTRRHKDVGLDQLALEVLGHVPQAGFERTRATFWDVIRAAEVHRYKAVLVENVLEVTRDWELFDTWLQGMGVLGYEHQFVSITSAHAGGETNAPAPQWRDRIYIVLTHKGVRLPDVDPRPLAWCPKCDEIVHAVQWWKRPGRKLGKYGQQYLYRCPNGARCSSAIVEPFVLPAAAAIDWSDHGERIGDRTRPLADATMARIQAGLDAYAQAVVVAAAGNTWERPGSGYVRAWPAYEAPLMARTGTSGDGVAIPPFMTSVNHDGDGRHYPVHSRPLPTRTAKIGDGLVIPPLVGELRRNSTARPADEAPLQTVTGGGSHHYLLAPPGAFYVKNYGGNARPQDMVREVSEPLGTVTARDHHALVIPYRRGAKAYPAGAEPLSAVTTRESHGVSTVAVDINDVQFRMLKPREHLAAQRFPADYIVLGNGGEQTMQAGNAVSCNVAQWLGERLLEVL